jgi:hypothetical protein
MNKEFCNMLRVANRLFLLLLGSNITVITILRIIALLIASIKGFANFEFYHNALTKYGWLLELPLNAVLIFVFAEKFMNFIRVPFRKFSLEIVDPSVKTKSSDRRMLFLLYILYLLGYSFGTLLICTVMIILTCKALCFVAFLLPYSVCILLTKFYILKKYTIHTYNY